VERFLQRKSLDPECRYRAPVFILSPKNRFGMRGGLIVVHAALWLWTARFRSNSATGPAFAISFSGKGYTSSGRRESPKGGIGA
jgi:hypothetical protein